MWKLEYSTEAKFYFLDSGDLVFGLLVEITKLSRVQQGYHQMDVPISAMD